MASQKLNLDLVQEMVTNYKSKQYLSIVTNKINPMTFDAQSVWFSLDALKAFIDTIETEVAKHPQYPVSNFGLRFYYSAYPANDTWDKAGFEDIAGLNPLYEKLHTLIAIPTASINGINSDFDPCDVKTYSGTKPTVVGCAIMAENHGELIPPGSNLGTWF
jgi:hypothetical protein